LFDQIDLNVLGVHPDAQGQGVGRLLTQWGIDQAKKEGADAFLVATEREFSLVFLLPLHKPH